MHVTTEFDRAHAFATQLVNASFDSPSITDELPFLTRRNLSFRQALIQRSLIQRSLIQRSFIRYAYPRIARRLGIEMLLGIASAISASGFAA